MKTTCGSQTRGNPGARRGIRISLITLTLAVIACAALARPPARTSSRMVWSPTKERIIMFGGSTPADSSRQRTYLNDLWEWDTNRWTPVVVADPPVGRAGHAMVWDSAQSRLLVHGGIRGFDDDLNGLLFDDLWALEGGSWRPLNPATKPEARQSHAFAFDMARNRFMIYGGYDSGAQPYFDTWEFDGVDWTRVLASGPTILSPLMVYDPARNETLLLGTTNESVLADRKTEMYRRSESGWTKIELPTDGYPKCTAFGGLIFEELYTRVIFQGGGCATGTALNETWAWHGTEWVRFAPRTTPGFVTGFGFANEPTRRQSVLFGGIDFEERSVSYTFQGNNWAPANDIWSPGARSLFGFQTDTETGRIILMGGIDDQRSSYNDMWSLRSGSWEKMNPSPYPDSCFNPLTVWDSDRRKLVALCDDGDVSEWDTVKWTTFNTLQTKPGFRRFRNAVYDPKLKKTVMFGGFDEINYLRETWTWNGSTWTKLSKDAKSPSARCLTAMFFDPVSQRTLVFGGIGRPTSDHAVARYGDMWAFDGTKWAEIKPTSKPAIRYGAITGFNPETNTVVMFGGKSEHETYLDEHWEWNGQNWTEVNPDSRPSARMNGGMAVDPTSGKLTMFGGWSGYYQQEIWSWSNGKWEVVPVVTQRGRPTRPGTGTGPDSTPTIDLPESGTPVTQRER